jgi:hypothetical protein
MGMATNRPVATFEAEVRTEDLGFLLLDDGASAEELTPPNDDDLVGAGKGALMFASSLGYHTPIVCIERWMGAPPEPPDRQWDEQQDVQWSVEGGTLRLCSLVSRWQAGDIRDLRPGLYSARVFRRGAAEALAVGEQPGWEPKGIEQWLIQLWPAESDIEPHDDAFSSA